MAELAIDRARPDTTTEAALLPPSQRYINRELSWLAFNERVLEEASNSGHPLLERVRFLSISDSNLDEFYMVRVAALKELAASGLPVKSDDGLPPEQQLAAIAEVAAGLVQRQQRCWADLQKRLHAEGISILDHEALTGEDRAWLRQLFIDRLLPVLTPIAIDPAHPFPLIPNRALAIVVELHREDEAQINALVLVPERVDRFIRLPGEQARFILVEEVLLAVGLAELFPGMKPLGHGLFRALRNSDIEIEEKAQDLVVMFESALKRRRRGQIIRLTISADTPERLSDFVIERTGTQPQDVVVLDGMVALSDVRQLIISDRPDLLFPPFTPRFPERIKDYGGDCFAAIRAKDIVVHHPYESFDVVVQFVRQAADDPNVIAIKQTLYRTSEDSPIVAALVDAAESGKSVTALVELKARFDEERNIRWARRLEQAGAQVIFGFVDLKTHAKVSLVARREGEALRSYVHFGTGNYHPVTAKIYTDLSFFTCDGIVPRRGPAVQLHHRICSAPAPRKAGDFSRRDKGEAHRADRGRDCPCRGRPAGGNLGKAQRARGCRHDRSPLSRLAGRRFHLARRPWHVLFAPGGGRALRKHHGQDHHRAFPGARPDHMLRRRARPPVARGPGVHFVGRLDAAKPRWARRDARSDREPDRAPANSRPDHGGKPPR